VDECKPPAPGIWSVPLDLPLNLLGINAAGEVGRGLHSSTFQHNLSALCQIGGAFRGCLGGVRGHSGVFGVYLVSQAA